MRERCGGKGLAERGRSWLRALGALAASTAVVLGGCGRPAGVIFDPANAAYQWPGPPDEPRVRYVGSLTSDADLKPGVSGLAALGETLFGKEDQHFFLSPIAVCSDGGSRVFVVDSNAQLVHMCDLSTRRYERWVPPKEAPPFSMPVAAAWDPAGRLLVSDSVAGRIVVFDGSGSYVGELGSGVLSRPCGIAVDSRGGRLFVADSAAHQVVVLGLDGREVARIGERGAGPGQFNFPTQVTLDRRGRLLVSDSLNFRVQIFSDALEPVTEFGTKGDMPGYFSQPKGLGVDSSDRLFVVDANFEAVQVFDVAADRPVLLMTFGREGRGPGEFWLPSGLHVDGEGKIWVADTYNRRVQVFAPIERAEAAGVSGDTAGAEGEPR